MRDEHEATESETAVLTPDATVFVVDDDEAMRQSLRLLLESHGLAVETCASGQEFLDVYDPARPGCLVLDLYMPGMSGLELQAKLAAEEIRVPIIIITAHGDVPNAVSAMKAGAVDFIEKPLKPRVFLERIRQAVALAAQMRRDQATRAEIAGRIARLTPREREVMDLVAAGKANKQIARELGISRKTVEIHRAHLMEKMRADSVAALVRMALIAAAQEPLPDPGPS